MRKRILSLALSISIILALFPCTTFAYTDIKITKDGQVVDTFAGVDAIYATLSSYSNVDTNTTYSCAAFLKKYCKQLWGVTISDINTIDAAPTVRLSGHTVSLKTVSSPRAGDIMQTKNYGHVAVVKSISGSNAILIEQNWSYNQNGYRYARKDRSVAISSVYFYRMIIDGKEAEVPGITPTINKPATPTITNLTASGSTVNVSWNSANYASEYTVDFWKVDGSHNYYKTTNTSYSISLVDGQYGIRVEASNSVETSGFSGFSYIWVSTNTVPTKPTIKGVKVNDSNFTVLWDWVDYTGQYVVDFWKVDGNHDYVFTGSNSLTKSLSDGVYGVRMEARNTNGVGSGFTSFYYIHVGRIPIVFDANGGEIEKTKARIKYDSINGTRGLDQLVIFTNAETNTGTNMYGAEVLVDSNNKVTNIIDYVGNATVPNGGFILSGNREKYYWLMDNVNIGDYVNYHPNTQEAWIWSENGWLSNTKSVVFGNTYGKMPVPLPRDGYNFIGWFTEPNGGKQITSDTIVSLIDNQTLYAQWEYIKPHTETKIEIKEKLNIHTDFINILTGTIIVAGYKNNRLIDFITKDYATETETFELPIDIDTVKVMVWDSLNNIKPLTETETIMSSEFKKG